VKHEVEEKLGWHTETDKRGFPFAWWSRTIVTRQNDGTRWVLNPNHRSTRSALPEGVIELRGLLNDCALGMIVVLGAAQVCEWRIRRREALGP
jgi:hypothetical protein